MFRKKRAIYGIISLIICILIIITAFIGTYFFYIKHMKEKFESEIDMANSIIEDNQKYLYITANKIQAGELITKDNIIKSKVFTNIKEEMLITEEDIGKALLINLDGGLPLCKTMLSHTVIEDDIREEQFNTFYLNSNLKENDYVDLRILYPNGEDYIVLSKKSIKNISLENSLCFMWLNAQEQLTISSAIVDTYLREGTKLYTTKYIEPNIQKKSQTTYIPSVEVINLIKSEPNILEIAKANLSEQIRIELEVRLNEFYLSEPNINLDSNEVIVENEEEEFYYVD